MRKVVISVQYEGSPEQRFVDFTVKKVVAKIDDEIIRGGGAWFETVLQDKFSQRILPTVRITSATGLLFTQELNRAKNLLQAGMLDACFSDLEAAPAPRGFILPAHKV